MEKLSRYRVLNAMLALGEFTVADLARYSEVKETTVRTVLSREDRFVERDGVRPQGRRGGQPIQYRLRPDAEEHLTRILRELERVPAGLPPAADDQEDPLMLPLLTAEDILIRQLPTAPPADRAGLVDLAVADYETVRSDIRPDHGEVHTHGCVVNILLQLAEVEQEVLALAPPTTDAGSPDWPAEATRMLSGDSRKKLEALGGEWHRLLSAWKVTSDGTLLPDLVQRVATSWFSPIILRATRDDSAAVTTRSTGWRRQHA